MAWRRRSGAPCATSAGDRAHRGRADAVEDRRQIDRTLWPCLVTYADEWQGHTGTIYRADNWEYLGMTKPEPTYTLNGRMIARKAGPRTRTHEEMIALGAVMIGRFAKHKFRHVAPGAGKRIEKQGALEL